MFNLMDAMLGHRALQEMGFSDEAISTALSKRRYFSECELVNAVRAEQDRIYERALTETP